MVTSARTGGVDRKRLLVAATLLLALGAALYLFARPQLVRLYDLTLPQEGLYEPVLSTKFDLWEPGNRKSIDFRCTRSQRLYEVALEVPAENGESLPRTSSIWPDLGGRFQLRLSRKGAVVLEKSFDGRAASVQQRYHGDWGPARLLRLATFFIEDCDQSVIELRVLEPATGLQHLRRRAHVVVRVSPAI